MTHQRIQFKPSHNKIIRFVSVGTFNTVFNVCVFDALVFAFGIGNLFANFISLIASTICSYFLNKFFVFKDSEKVSGAQLGNFMAGTFIIQLVAQHLAVWLLGEKYTGLGIALYRFLVELHIPLDEHFVVLNSAKFFGVIFSIVVSYLFYDRLIFKLTEQPS